LPPDNEPFYEVNPAALAEGQLRQLSVGTGLLNVVLV
jgi:hypothetical protein